MVTSIILMKIKEQASKEAIEDYFKNLYKLKDKIPGIVSISGGANLPSQERNKGFDQGVVMVFENEEARKAYNSHEEHTIFLKKYTFPIIDDVLIFNF